VAAMAVDGLPSRLPKSWDTTGGYLRTAFVDTAMSVIVNNSDRVIPKFYCIIQNCQFEFFSNKHINFLS